MAKEAEIIKDPNMKFQQGVKYVAPGPRPEPMEYVGYRPYSRSQVFKRPLGNGKFEYIEHDVPAHPEGSPLNFESRAEYIAHMREQSVNVDGSPKPLPRSRIVALAKNWDKMKADVKAPSNPVLDEMRPLSESKPKSAMEEAFNLAEEAGNDIVSEPNKYAPPAVKKKIARRQKRTPLSPDKERQRGEVVLPDAPDPEDVARVAREAAAKSVGRLNISHFPDEQQAQIKDLYRDPADRAKLKSAPVSMEEIKARAEKMNNRPFESLQKRMDVTQEAAEYLNLQDEVTSKLKALRDSGTASAPEIDKAMRSVVESLQKVKSAFGYKGWAMSEASKASDEQVAIIRELITQIRRDPGLSRRATQQAIAQLIKPLPDIKQGVNGPSIYKYLMRASMMSGPITPLVGVESNIGTTLVSPLVKAFNVTVDKVVSAIAKRPTPATYKEVGAVVKGMLEALQGKKLDPELFAKNRNDTYGNSPFDVLSDLAPTGSVQSNGSP
jgi:hypothetical protein